MNKKIESLNINKKIYITSFLNIVLPVFLLLLEYWLDLESIADYGIILLEVLFIFSYLVFLLLFNYITILKFIDEAFEIKIVLFDRLVLLVLGLIPFFYQSILIVIFIRLKFNNDKTKLTLDFKFFKKYFIFHALLIYFYFQIIRPALLSHSFIFKFLKLTRIFEWI